jgi:hypothetical protein
VAFTSWIKGMANATALGVTLLVTSNCEGPANRESYIYTQFDFAVRALDVYTTEP